MKIRQIGIFNEANRYERLSKLGDPLEKLDSVMDREMFRKPLTAVCQKEDYTKGGRPPVDVIIKFKASVLRRIYNLSFDRIEYQINDRLSLTRPLSSRQSKKQKNSAKYPKADCANCADCYFMPVSCGIPSQ